MRPTEPILALGLPQIEAANDKEHFGAVPGSLATALRDDHRRVGVIANADQTADEPIFRQAGLMAIDTDGQVAEGSVGRSLLEADEDAPFGVMLGSDAVLDAFDHTWSRSAVTVVEMSDLARAEAARPVETVEQGDRQFARAIRHDDAIIGRILARTDAHTRVMVVAPAAPADVEQITVFSIAGPNDVPGGIATSSTTRRAAYVTLTDVAPTILDQWNVPVPDAMSDTLISTAASSQPFGEKVDQLIDDSNRALVRDSAFGTITVIFVVLLVVDLVLGMLYLARWRSLGTMVQILSLVVLWVPPLTFLQGLLPIGRMDGAWLGITLFAGAVVAALATWWFGRRGRLPLPWYPLLVTWMVLAVDIVTGGHLQINTVFGYSPIVAGRFAGFGNQAYSILAICTLLLITSAWDLFGGEPDRPRFFFPAMIGFLAVTVVLDGLPSFGSDVGGVLALVPAGAICLLVLARVRIRVRLVVGIVAGTVAAITVFALIDLARPADERTHLGRFVAKLFSGDGAEIIQRKIAANLSVLTTVWSWVIPFALVYFAYLTWRPNATFAASDAWPQGPACLRDRRLGARSAVDAAERLGRVDAGDDAGRRAGLHHLLHDRARDRGGPPVIVALVAFVVSALAATAAWHATQPVFAAPVFARTNYRDHPLPTSVGLLIAVVGVSLLAVVELLWSPLNDSLDVHRIVVDGPAMAGLLLGFSLLGLLDDIAGVGESGGFRGHLRALADGRMTTGSIKLFGGAAVAVAVVGVFRDPGWGGMLVDAAIICLAANLANLLDRAPGRTIKVGMAALVAIAVSRATSG